MFGKAASPRLRQIALSVFLLTTSIASANSVDNVREAGFSRVKVAFRTRAWKDDPAAIPALVADQQDQSIGGFEVDAD